MAGRWEEKEKEDLYYAARKHAGLLSQYKIVDISTDAIKNIYNYIDTFRDISAILYKLKDMRFLKTHKDSYQKGCFLVNSLQKTEFFNFKIAPDYKELTDEQRIEFKNQYEKAALKTCNVDDLCKRMSDSLVELSPLRIRKELFILGLIELNALIEHQLVSPLIKEQKDEILMNKELSSEEKQQINNFRKEISGIYDTHLKDNPSITYSSDGTGTGKSYSVVDRFIQRTDINNIENGHRNLLFLTPQKAQINIAPELKKDAEKKKIKILSFLAQGDMSNIDFKNWVTEEVSKNVFDRWIQFPEFKSDGWLKEHVSRLEKTVRDADYFNQEIPKAEKRGDFETIDDCKERQKKNSYKLRDSLEKLAEAILQQKSSNGKYIPISDRFDAAKNNKNGKPNKAKILSEIIDFVLPFERAKLSPCILLATSDKFDYNVNIAINNKKDGKPVIKSMPFDYILGQKIKPDTSDDDFKTADVNGRPFKEQIEFLKNDYFITDEDNYFYQKNISFTVIVDEEHIAYNKFFDRSKKTLIDDKTQIAHVFSVVNRIVQSFESVTEDEKDDFVLYDAHESFVNELKKLFTNKCKVSNGITLHTILNIFSNNLRHISIDSKEIEQVIQICKNVFSITPKRFFNEQNLKKIRIGAYRNNTECRIYYERKEADSNPTMHDVLQALLCVFAACSHIKDKDFRSMIRHGAENSQNALLDQFVRKAREARVSVEAMFDRVDDEELYIDDFFTYFTPKIVFSIEKIKDLPFKSEQLKNKVYVTFRLDLFEALPEVTLMRILHNTKNAVVCLSATSGFKDTFNGNYCRPVMKKYGYDIKDNLNYRSIQRTEEDIEKLKQLRECRGKARKVTIAEFVDTENNRITEAYKDNEFQECYLKWKSRLRPYFDTSNPYHIDGFNRQIEAMLLTAYDKKNSLVLSLTNKFLKIIRDFIKEGIGSINNLKGFKIIDNKTYKIFEIKPFNNGVVLRVILFDADLAKTLSIDNYLELDNTNTKIVFISSYQSAGTGLNLFTRYKGGIDEDFERLVLINSPFYSNILTQDGLNSINNYVLLLKHYAENSTAYQLKDFDVNLVHGENYKILMQEHVMSMLKDIMQAVGRVERRDTYMITEIFLPNDVAEDLALQFSRLKKGDNELIFESMSLLNYKLMLWCLDKAEKHSFKSNEEREKFSTHIAEMEQAIDKEFLNIYLCGRLNDARQGDKSAVKLNDTLRSFDCIENPQKYINNILKLPEIQQDDYLQHIVNNFYLSPDKVNGITVCTKNNDKKILTDLLDGDRVYKPYNWIIPAYHKSSYHQNSTATPILKPIFPLRKKLAKAILPHPAMLPIFKGNIGEYLFAKCLSEINITPLSIDEMFTQLSPKVYELFDFYVLKENKLFCIDVKNWSSSFDKEEQALETHEKALRKIETLINEVTREKNLTHEFIYVNTHQDRNAINSSKEFDDSSSIHYLNLFKIIPQYEDAHSNDPKKKSKLKDRLNINSSLINLLGGSLNG